MCLIKTLSVLPFQGNWLRDTWGRHWANAGDAAAALRVYAAERGLERMPTQRELTRAGRHDLRYALKLHGTAALASMLGFPEPRRGRPRAVQKVERLTRGQELKIGTD